MHIKKKFCLFEGLNYMYTICYEQKEWHGLQKIIDETEPLDIPDVLLENSAFPIYNSMLGLNIAQLADLESYIDIMEKYFTAELWNEMEGI